MGSSPLARGLRATTLSGTSAFGIIPARAGFTKTRNPYHSLNADHPRSRGVYGRPWVQMLGHGGSSPLARGLHLRIYQNDDILGIIPARAGFTVAARTRVRDARDHPRSRGVYRLCVCVLFVRLWIIPARAGFTRGVHSGAEDDRDHPRSRGVYSRVWLPEETAAGSSPLARGLRTISPEKGPRHGIIPARAGFT